MFTVQGWTKSDDDLRAVVGFTRGAQAYSTLRWARLHNKLTTSVNTLTANNNISVALFHA